MIAPNIAAFCMAYCTYVCKISSGGEHLDKCDLTRCVGPYACRTTRSSEDKRKVGGITNNNQELEANSLCKVLGTN